VVVAVSVVVAVEVHAAAAVVPAKKVAKSTTTNRFRTPSPKVLPKQTD